MKCVILISMLCYLALAGIVSCSEAGVNNNGAAVANAIENETSTHIFIQEGTNGSFVNDGSGNYTLTMIDVVPYTVFFADRPARDVGFAPMDKFLKGFNFGVDNPPNAAIILPDENETSDLVVVELTKPQYNNTTQTLTYNAKLLKEYSFESGWLQDHASEVDPAIPERFGTVEVVIDGCPCQYVGPAAGCDATWWRNARWTWHGFPVEFGCMPAGGCCSCKGACCPGQNCDKSKNPTTPKPPVVPVKEKTNEVKYPYTKS